MRKEIIICDVCGKEYEPIDNTSLSFLWEIPMFNTLEKHNLYKQDICKDCCKVIYTRLGIIFKELRKLEGNE